MFSSAIAARISVDEPDVEWILSSSSLACETNDDPHTVVVLETSTEQSLQDCFHACEERLDCVAVDWFPDMQKCNKFPRACTAPTASGGMTYVMAQEPMKAKACASWNETMYFLGEDWLSTDVNPQNIINVMQETFSECEPDDEVTVRIEEKDVGYSLGSGLATRIYNSILMYYNSQHRLYHSGVRFTGCGKTVMFQLQIRVWGLSNAGPVGTTAFGASQQFPVTSPDGHTMWNELICNVPGRGIRDLGAGNIVYYKVEEATRYIPWVRGEFPIAKLHGRDITEFVSGVARYFSWWNIESRYSTETVFWEGADGVSTKLKEQVTCDTFTLWLASQLIAFRISKGYSAHFPRSHWEGVHFNKLQITVSDANSDDGPSPMKGLLSELVASDRDENERPDMEDGLVRAWSMTDKQATSGIWSTVKGAGICWDVPVEERSRVLHRNWRDSREHSTTLNRFSFLHGSNPFDRRFWCVDRVSMAISGYDLVSFGPWRFFYLGNDNYVAAMDWDVKVEGSYDTYGVFNSEYSKAIVPGGTPLGPWSAYVQSTECGDECPWEYPIPDPGEEGFLA